MSSVADVTAYITDNILRSNPYDNATPEQQSKAVNQAVNMLTTLLPTVYSTKEPPISDVAEQALWLLKLDDTMDRADMGASSISVDGISITFTDMDRSIAPNVLKRYGMRTARRVRVGGYHLPPQDTFRINGGGFRA